MLNPHSKIAYVRAIMIDLDRAKVIETHAIPNNGLAAMRKQVKKILGQWMEHEDFMVDMESNQWESGEACKPFTIWMSSCMETSDIFAQLIY